jgi:hypothetical protein
MACRESRRTPQTCAIQSVVKQLFCGSHWFALFYAGLLMSEETQHNRGSAAGPAGTEAIISVRHKYDDGWHTFTSPQVPGLYLVGKTEDLEGLYAAIPR